MTYPVAEIQQIISEEHQSRLIDMSMFAMTDDVFFAFCQANDHLKLERNPDGTILFMALTGGISGENNAELNIDLGIWKRRNGGHIYDSSTGFRLPDGSVRSPDAAWLSEEKYAQISDEDRRKHLPVAPEFLVELMSETDNLKEAQNKMLSYIENGVLLGWLINPKMETVYIYRADGTISKVEGFSQTLSGEQVLAGFEFDLGLLKK
jgi:Uma2 family endonuclease